GLGDPKIRARLADLGGTVLAGSPADYGKLLDDETEKWRKGVKFSGARAECPPPSPPPFGGRDEEWESVRDRRQIVEIFRVGLLDLREERRRELLRDVELGGELHRILQHVVLR